MRLLLALFCGVVFVLHSDNFTTFENDTIEEFEQYKIDLKRYKQAYKEAFEVYEQKIKRNFSTVDVSDHNRWVSYINNFKIKNIVDFEREKIIIQTHATDMQDARNKIYDRFESLVKLSVKEAFEKDFVEQHVAGSLGLSRTINARGKIVEDIYTKTDLDSTRSFIKKAPIKKSIYRGRPIYTLELAMPPKALLRKAKRYEKSINRYALKEKLPKELVFAIIHSESSYNPMARSRVPAFGLMQIVPESAGVDSYRYLYGKRIIPSANYLYNEQRNIKLGTAYLHILFYSYLQRINDPLSRLYCTIAAYNTGAGNVAKSFVGNYDTKAAAEVINTMTPKQVYEYLMQNLPFVETKRYLQKVRERIFTYRSWLQKQQG